MLRNIKIKNFKSIKDQDVNLNNLNVLIGQIHEGFSGKANDMDAKVIFVECFNSLLLKNKIYRTHQEHKSNQVIPA